MLGQIFGTCVGDWCTILCKVHDRCFHCLYFFFGKQRPFGYFVEVVAKLLEFCCTLQGVVRKVKFGSAFSK